MFDIVEMMNTISGEAPIPGVPVFLIRFSGCNLDCVYCDTDYKNEKNLSLTREELLTHIRARTTAYPALRILFTGGEPLLAERQDLLLSVASELKDLEFYIETNGSVKINNPHPANCHFVVDWKTASSGTGASFCPENLKVLHKEKDCIKFILNKEDLKDVKEKIAVIRAENPGLPVYFSPQYRNIEPELLAEFILENRLPVVLSIQLHKIIWKEKTRGV